MSKRIAIIGAGITGLTAAYDLVKAGYQVVIFEAAGSVGGLAAGFRHKTWDYSLEKYYHHWFASDTAVFNLIDELGWSKQVLLKSPSTVIYHQGAFYPFDSPRAILAFPGFDFFKALRFGTVTLYLKYLSSWQLLESQTAHHWLRRWYGAEIYRLVWQPLLKGKFGPYHRQVTMAWMWARLKARTPKLATFKGGFQAFSDRFAAHLVSQGANLHLNTPVTAIHPGIPLTLTANHSQKFDACLVTTPPAIFQRLLNGAPGADFLDPFVGQPSLGACIAVFSLSQPLSPKGYYWHNLPKDQGFSCLAVVEHTNFVSPRHFGGQHLVYCGDYPLPGDPVFKLSDQAIIKQFTPALKKINPNFSSSWINQTWVFKTPYAQPVPLVNHSQHLPPLKTPLNHVYWASMAHIYPWDRGTNFAVDLGHKVAGIMIKDIN